MKFEPGIGPPRALQSLIYLEMTAVPDTQSSTRRDYNISWLGAPLLLFVHQHLR